MKKNISIYDIARSLNVSASTVSRALQDHPRISSEVRKMVQKKDTQLCMVVISHSLKNDYSLNTLLCKRVQIFRNKVLDHK